MKHVLAGFIAGGREAGSEGLKGAGGQDCAPGGGGRDAVRGVGTVVFPGLPV